MTTSPEPEPGLARATAEITQRPLVAIAYALVMIARDMRQIAGDVRDIRRAGARR